MCQPRSQNHTSYNQGLFVRRIVKAWRYSAYRERWVSKIAAGFGTRND